jgi:eukaryotic-like serine/threonine-protein kinase
MTSQTKSSKSKKRETSQLAGLKSLGRYKISRLVGAGGMGSVFKATDEELKRTVALKVLPKEKAENPTLVKRFKSEAQASAHLNHQNIVRVFDHGEVDGYLYIAMEYVSGVDVHELMERQGVLSPKRSMDIVRQVTLALQHAYEQNIVHRDIKPSNLMIDKEGTIKLADMGLARCMSDTESTALTQAGSTVGTVDYMSPEQARDSKSADTRSDMYSLGATWFHMLIGHSLFPNGDLLNKIHAHCSTPAPDPRDEKPEVPDAIAEIVLKMLEKEPEDRYQTPGDLLHDIETADLEKREVTIGLIASLASEDNLPVAPAATPTLKNRSRSRDADSRSKTQSKSKRKAARESSPARDESKKSREKTKRSRSEDKQERRRSKSSGKPKRNESTKETRADHDTDESSVPSARDAMLNRPMLRRGEASRKKKMKVSLDTGRLFGIVAGFVVLIIVGALIVAEFRGGTDSDPGDTQDTATPNNPAPAPIADEPIPGSQPNSSQPKSR